MLYLITLYVDAKLQKSFAKFVLYALWDMLNFIETDSRTLTMRLEEKAVISEVGEFRSRMGFTKVVTLLP